MTRHRSGVAPVLATWTTLALCCALPSAAWAEALPEALAKAYQTNPQLNAERARQRATDENVPQALAGYRPQIVASLSAGLQSVRNLLPDNTIQTANLKPWIIGVTVTQTLFNGFRTANNVRAAELQVQSGREALRNVGQGVLLDAVTAYTNVLANQSLVEARSAPTSRSCAKRSPSPSAASTPAMSRRPTAPRPRRGSTAGFPISTPPKSRWR
ncbi:outer membrane protein TolC [Bradyrhizobium sp. LM3.6]